MVSPNHLRPIATAVLAGAVALAVLAFGHRPTAPMRPARPAPQHRPNPAAIPRPLPAPSPTPSPAPLVVKRVLPIGVLKFGEHHWDEAGVPAGPLVITVDLDAQVLSVFRDGYEIGAAAILYGTDDTPTPLGRFPITQKDAHHVSNIYNAPMPYMLRLTNDGISVHGAEVEWGWGTHGCIGVPVAFAKQLFAAAKIGDPVIITRGKTLAVGGAITR